MQYIDCKKYSQEILDAVKAIPNKKKLVILTAGYDAASQSYVKGKIKDCEYCGIPYEHVTAKTELELDVLIYGYKNDPTVGGIIIQLPLPKGWDEHHFVNQVPLHLDVDGFRANSPFKPCTPEGIMYLLHKEIGDLTGKRALVIGRGKLVGEPIAKMLLDADCTVTVAHSKTTDLHWELQNAEIIISAVGKPNTVNLAWCWNAEAVIDVGVNRDANGKLVGDCYGFSELHNPSLKVTPVPGGIGLMTRAMLMAHVANLSLED
jgi:methylenetetrahydrofolate dehydrogenase (NADP+)/methenyltetrahydrofolate cyclohydrolase